MSIIRPFRADDLFRFNNVCVSAHSPQFSLLTFRVYRPTATCSQQPRYMDRNGACLLAACHTPAPLPLPRPSQPHITHHFSLSCDATQVVWPRLLFQLPLTLAGHVLCRAAPERTPDGIRQVFSYVVHARLRAHLISSHPAPIAALYIHCIQSWARQKGLRMTSTATSPPCRSRPNTGVFRSRASL